MVLNIIASNVERRGTQMKRHVKRTILFICFVLVISFGLCTAAYAETIGNTMTNPVIVSLGQTYSMSWNKDTDHLYHYNKVVLDQKGILKFTFSKPYDSDAEYGSLKFTVANEDGESIWESKSNEAQEKASPNYVNYICLNPGTYYVNVVPGFYVTSGTIDTTYSFSFEPAEYIEVEPNESTSKATNLKIGTFYTGYYGNDYGDYGENDFFKFYLKKGSSYRLYLDNYDELDATTCIMDFFAPNGEEISTYDWKLNSYGYRYIEFIAPATGYHYFQLTNYSKLPIKYRIRISHALAPAKTSITGGYNFSYYDNEISVRFNEKTNVAGYEVQYSTDKSKISSGKIKKVAGEDNYDVDIKGVIGAKRYYVRVRTYKTINGTKKYSSWSKVKTLIY